MNQALEKLQTSFSSPRHAAKHAGLRYVVDNEPGLYRVRAGKGFGYRNHRGKSVRDPKALARIRALVIPPAWTDVWICPNGDGHIQAIGYDARGRKQYRYHPDWRAHRDLAKYTHVIEFAEALPRIREVTRRHLRKKGLPRDKVLAATVRVMEKTLMRVGNDQYARDNDTYGLTTLKDRHAKVSGNKVVFDFRAKHGIKRNLSFHDPRLSQIIRECRDLPGDELFQYKDENGKVRDIVAGDVNAYLQQITGQAFTAKDFRTWAGTVLAANALMAMEEAKTKNEIKKNIVRAIEHTAARLGNTVAVCRKCYVHPAVLNSYVDGSLIKQLRRKITGKLMQHGGFSIEEQSVLRLLRQTLSTVKTIKRAA